MNREVRLLVTALREHPHYPDFVSLVEKTRPINPRFDPVKGNTEEWKARSSQQAGFDLFASLLDITFGD